MTHRLNYSCRILAYAAVGLFEVLTLAGCPDFWIDPPDGKFFRPGVDAYEMDAQPTRDGGVILTGSTDDLLANGIYVVRTDDKANSLWQKQFPGLGSTIGQAVRETSDGSFIIVGTTGAPSTGNEWGPSALYLLRIDRDGTKVWDNTLFGLGQAWAVSMDAAPDGSFLVIGETRAGGPESPISALLVRFQADGTIVSQSVFDPPGQYVTAVVCTPDGGYVIGASQADYTAGLARYDARGQEVWRKTYSPIPGIESESLCVAPDGGFVVAGNQLFGTEGPTVFLLKVDSNGNQVWTRTWSMMFGELHDVQPVDGGFAVTGTVWYGKYFMPSIYVAKFDTDGNRAWDTALGGQFSNGYSVGKLSNGKIMVAGNASSRNVTINGSQYRAGMYLAIVDANGIPVK
ncbi:MAG: hypothetical protein HZB26_26505 [Candidatus Hydrogenedentes bacterium]|nr:hypothetical protein [Candidatus Hydrogenedentota bacterium]